MGDSDEKFVSEMADEHQSNNGAFKQNPNGRGSFKHLALKVTFICHQNSVLLQETGAFTLKLEMDELFSASFNVSFTQLTIMSSLTFCPPPISSRMFNVYLSKIKK